MKIQILNNLGNKQPDWMRHTRSRQKLVLIVFLLAALPELMPRDQAAAAEGNAIPDGKTLLGVPFVKLVRIAMGLERETPANVDANTRSGPEPEVVAAYTELTPKQRLAARNLAALDAHEAQEDYASSMASRAASLGGVQEVEVGGQVRGTTGVSVPKPPDLGPQQYQYYLDNEAAESRYRAAYAQFFGDPSGKYPDPFVTPATKSRNQNQPQQAIKPVGVTTENEVLVYTTRGWQDHAATPRLWLVNSSNATIVLQDGDPLTKGGKPFGKILSFQVIQGDNLGHVLLLARLAGSKEVYLQSDSVLLWAKSDGAQVIASPSEPIPGMTGEWFIRAINTCILSPDGEVAFTCDAIRKSDAKQRSPVLLYWDGSLLRTCAYPLDDPRETTFQLGNQTVTRTDNPQMREQLDIAHPKFLGHGRLGIPAVARDLRLGVRNPEQYRLWVVNAGNGGAVCFNPHGRNDSWFGPDGRMTGIKRTQGPAQSPANRQSGNFQSVARPPNARGNQEAMPARSAPFLEVFAGPPEAMRAVLAFQSGPVADLGPRQMLSLRDAEGRTARVALGPEGRIAFSAHIEGPCDIKYDPEKGKTVVSGGRPAPQWVLLAGREGQESSVHIVGHEFIPCIGSNSDGKNDASGCLKDFQFTDNGTLLFTTTGRFSTLDSGQHEQADQVGFVWSWDGAELRIIASYSQKVLLPAGTNGPLGHFSCKLASDGRAILTRGANDMVFFANVK